MYAQSIHSVRSGVRETLLAMRHARFLTRLITHSGWPCVSGESTRSVQDDRRESRRLATIDVDVRCFERDRGEDEDRTSPPIVVDGRCQCLTLLDVVAVAVILTPT